MGTIKWPSGFECTGQFQCNFPIDEDAFLHPDLKKVISQNRCTSIVTRDDKRYGQFVWECRTCSKDKNGEKCFCICCRDCHFTEYSDHQLQKRWVVCMLHCYCYDNPEKCKRGALSKRRLS